MSQQKINLQHKITFDLAIQNLAIMIVKKPRNNFMITISSIFLDSLIGINRK